MSEKETTLGCQISPISVLIQHWPEKPFCVVRLDGGGNMANVFSVKTAATENDN